MQPSTCHKAQLHKSADRASRKHVAPTTFTYLFLPSNTIIRVIAAILIILTIKGSRGDEKKCHDRRSEGENKQKKKKEKETWADKSGSKKATEKGGLTVIVPAF